MKWMDNFLRAFNKRKGKGKTTSALMVTWTKGNDQSHRYCKIDFLSEQDQPSLPDVLAVAWASIASVKETIQTSDSFKGSKNGKQIVDFCDFFTNMLAKEMKIIVTGEFNLSRSGKEEEEEKDE